MYDRTLASCCFSRVTSRATCSKPVILPPAMTGLEKELGQNVTVKTTGMDREPSPEIQIVLFRIAQEALNNVRKHSQANNTTISLTGSGDGIIMTVSDDGTGFIVPDHIEDRVSEGRLGLMGMDERAGLVGGSLKISSSPIRGTCLTVKLPWKVTER